METTKAEPTETFVKLSITLPPHLARPAEEKVAAGEAPSLSALAAHALQHALVPAEDELDELFRLWLAAGNVVLTEDNRAWARNVLALSTSMPARWFNWSAGTPIWSNWSKLPASSTA